MDTTNNTRGIARARTLQRTGELCGVLLGYAEALLERRFTNPPAYETISWEEALSDLDGSFGNVLEILNEPALRQVEESTRRLLANIREEDTFAPRWAADSLLARLCYLACRLTQPQVAIETGVAYGVSSVYILTALRQNGGGTLHSVDLPPPSRKTARFWGIAVPDDLKTRWNLHRGTSASIMPRLLRENPTVDLFVHDSLHTRKNMRREFDAVWPHLRPGGLLLADDIERNRAFHDLQDKPPALWRAVEDRETTPLHGKAAPVLFGLAMK